MRNLEFSAALSQDVAQSNKDLQGAIGWDKGVTAGGGSTEFSWVVRAAGQTKRRYPIIKSSQARDVESENKEK